MTRDQFNDACLALARIYESIFGAGPAACLLRSDCESSLRDEVFDGLQSARLEMGGFAHGYHSGLVRFRPGVWNLDGDDRFRRLLLLVGLHCVEDYSASGGLLVAMGPDGSVEAFSEWFDRQVIELRQPRLARSWDDVILPGDLAALIRREVEDFLSGHALYGRLGLPWKKGMLFCGEPGNGKTHTIRVIAAEYGLETTTRVSARQIAQLDSDDLERHDREGRPRPHLVVFEDIDRLFSEGRTGSNADLVPRFLNALDGFDEVEGCLVLATANDVECLDPAIRSRPSRFDRVIEFPSPDLESRRRYLTRMIGNVEGFDSAALADATAGFSFAFLKELCLCCLQHVRRGGRASQSAAAELIGQLRRHMTAGKKRIGLRR